MSVKVWKPGALSLQLGPACLLSRFCHLVRHPACRFFEARAVQKVQVAMTSPFRACWFTMKVTPTFTEKLINSTCYSWLTLLPAYPHWIQLFSCSHLVRGPLHVLNRRWLSKLSRSNARCWRSSRVFLRAHLRKCFPDMLESFCHRGSHFKNTGLCGYMLHVVVGLFQILSGLWILHWLIEQWMIGMSWNMPPLNKQLKLGNSQLSQLFPKQPTVSPVRNQLSLKAATYYCFGTAFDPVCCFDIAIKHQSIPIAFHIGHNQCKHCFKDDKDKLVNPAETFNQLQLPDAMRNVAMVTTHNDWKPT